MKNNFITLYGIFLICISIFNPLIFFFATWYFSPLHAVVKIPFLFVVFLLFLIPGVYFFRLGLSSRSVSWLLAVSAIIGAVSSIFITLIMVASNSTSIFGSDYVYIFSDIASFLSEDKDSYLFIMYGISILIFIVGAVISMKKKKKVEAESVLCDHKPFGRKFLLKFLLVASIFITLGLFYFVFYINWTTLRVSPYLNTATEYSKTQTPISLNETESWLVYRNEKQDFEIKYPQDWELSNEAEVISKQEKLWHKEILKQKDSQLAISVSVYELEPPDKPPIMIYNAPPLFIYDAPSQVAVNVGETEYTAYIFPKGYDCDGCSFFVVPINKGNVEYRIWFNNHKGNIPTLEQRKILYTFKTI